MKLSIIPILLILSFTAMGQGGRLGNKIEAQRIAFITNFINLTPDEAKGFWPVYNQYVESQKAIKKNAKSTKEIDDLTESEADKLIIVSVEKDAKLLDLKKEYIQKLKKVLPSKKIAKLYEAEQEFKGELINAIKERRRR
jgi:hypothetical protein